MSVYRAEIGLSRYCDRLWFFHRAPSPQAAIIAHIDVACAKTDLTQLRQQRCDHGHKKMFLKQTVPFCVRSEVSLNSRSFRSHREEPTCSGENSRLVWSRHSQALSAGRKGGGVIRETQGTQVNQGRSPAWQEPETQRPPRPKLLRSILSWNRGPDRAD
jgi:hypothetical protein